ncbi:hypothetical protein F4821DRAFT_22572 [Hypoxylon rubiginosum]|uniref:Uncharacterized protein n=1 Tax=Hypoxylon rubiginosum TaxID=110542 RepID=A0ACC0DDQ4_9PEZI|nr:hypothetical protein F4821DRAFT_22572 [Hypoxylon rubiginosum]
MKLVSVFACFLAGIATSAALPTENVAKTILSAMTWSGQVNVGGPSVSIAGTAEEIYKKIVGINPNYDNELGINSTYSALARRGLEPLNKRATTSSDYTCAYGNNIIAESVGVGVRYLYSIANGACSAPPGSPGNGGCTTTTCNSGAGIFLCNDSSNTLTTTCSIVADNAVEVLINCQSTTYAGGSTWTTNTHGQIFSKDRSWNVILNRC